MVPTNNYHFQGIITALTSITHGGDETLGTVRTLRREKLVLEDGTVEHVTVISGNALRSRLRDSATIYMLKRINYKPRKEAFDFLTSGGGLSKTGSGSAAIDLGTARRLRDLMPHVSVFGGSTANHIMRGKLKMGKIIPLCRETAPFVPEDMRHLCRASIWDMTQLEGYTRTDDKKNENMLMLMAPEARKAIAAAQEKSTRKHIEGKKEEKAEDEGPATQMRYEFETIAMGTKFFHEMFLDCVTDLELYAFFSAMSEFSKCPFIGGRSAVGHGKISLEYQEFNVQPNLRPTEGNELQIAPGRQYDEYLIEHRNEIISLLEMIV